MDLMEAFHQACAEFPQFRAQIAHARDLTPDPGIRAQLDGLLASLDHSFKEVKETVPRAVDEVKQRLARVEAEANAVTQSLAAAEKQRLLAEAALQAAKETREDGKMPVVAKPAGFDPIVAAQLRQEVLERFAGWRKLPGSPTRLDQQIWEDWSAAEGAWGDAPPDAFAEREVEETPPPVIAALLQLAGIEASDVVYNLGCGDGRILISAASKHGIRGVGIDGKADAVEAARQNLRTNRLPRLVTVDAGDPLTADVSPATVVFLTLGATQNSEVRDSLVRQLRAGARIVTHQGGLGGWKPDEERIVRDAEGGPYRLRLWRIHGRASEPDSSIGNLSEGDWESRTK